jgi:hypothetical protein
MIGGRVPDRGCRLGRASRRHRILAFLPQANQCCRQEVRSRRLINAPSAPANKLALSLAFSRRVVGWSMSAGMTAQLVADALLMAIWRRGKPDAPLRHSG